MNVATVSQSLNSLNHIFETSHPLKILEWTYQNRSRVKIGTSLGPSGIVILHLMVLFM